MDEWINQLETCVFDIDKIQELHTIDKVLDISVEHELEVYPSAILYHSEKDEQSI
jgi:hypothetical protein